METIRTQQDLQKTIDALESQQLEEKEAMHQYFKESKDHLKPVNLVKDTLHDINDSAEIKKALLKAAVALAIGYVTKRLIEKYAFNTKQRSPVKSRIGSVIEVLISAWVAKNGVVMKDIVMHFFKQILNKRLQERRLRLAE